MEYTFELYGHTYTVWTNDDGKITHTQCKYRWAKHEVAYLGDEWLIGELQSKVNELRD